MPDTTTLAAGPPGTKTAKSKANMHKLTKFHLLAVCCKRRYIHMEEMCKETAKARAIFDRWMAFEPDHAAWMAYIKVGGNLLHTGA